jgi:hypothetical protein
LLVEIIAEAVCIVGDGSGFVRKPGAISDLATTEAALNEAVASAAAKFVLSGQLVVDLCVWK